MARELYELGEAPPLGEVPAKMHAWLVREERFGEPLQAFQPEVVDVPEVADDEVLVWIMAAGVNYNNVWAALGLPINVIAARNKAGEPEPFHIGGSDASGIVYKIGQRVTSLKVGDEVVIHCGSWDANCPMVRSGEDPMYSPTFRIWGYETNWGSFAQFTRVQAHQCVPRPKHLTWEAAAAYMLVAATSYRMLLGWEEHALRKDDVVLVWGGAGGLGSMAIQIAAARGAVPIAVVSSDDKFDYCRELGARGCINRRDFGHWGMLPHWKDAAGYREWVKGAKAFGKAIWDALGERRNPRVVFEHPGEATIPTSIFVCETGGMVTICAGTTGYNATVDLRYLWMRQKRLQGSHFANDEQASGVNAMVAEGLVDPCLSRTFAWDELPLAHQLMYENKHPHGNMAILVNATEPGQGAVKPLPAAARRAVTFAEAERTARSPHYHPDYPEPPFADEPPLATEADPTTAGEMMGRRPVISCRPTDTVRTAAQRLVDSHIQALVVVSEHDEPIGVISQTDLVLARQAWPLAELLELRVEVVMTHGIETCQPDTPISEAITRMTRRRIHRLVVTEEQEGRSKAVGLLSMTDIVRRLLD
jgi:crotonyl-CoA carboxylase/reductase